MKPDREFVRKIEKELTDRGLIIEAGFTGFKLLAVPADVTDQQLTNLREVFFAGALHLFQSIMSIMEPGDEPTDIDLGRVDKIHQELDRFQAEVKLKYKF